MARSLYEKYGGFAAIGRIAFDFYERALESDAIGHHFETVDMPRLIDHQTRFVSFLFGGPASLTDERLRQAHARLGVTPGEFDAMAALLAETLEDHGLAAEDVEIVLRGVEARRGVIVS